MDGLACLGVLGHVVIKLFLDMVHVAGIVHKDYLLQQLVWRPGKEQDEYS